MVNDDGEEGEDRQNSVYLDTNVLANWLLLYRKSRNTRQLAEDRAQECMRLLDHVLAGRYLCRFLVSPYATSELSQSARDNLIALKIMRDGQSLVFFNRLKKRYRLKNWEQADIKRTIKSFTDFLVKKGFVFFDAGVHSDEVNSLSLKYGLETHDAIHLSIARRNAAYLVTNDPDFIEARPKIKEIEIVRPSTLETLRHLRKPMPR